jgi:hypothetical protein
VPAQGLSSWSQAANSARHTDVHSRTPKSGGGPASTGL